MDRVEPWKKCTNDECPFVGSWDESNMIRNSDHPDAKFPLSKHDIKVELRDPWNRDFRPCPASNAASKGAGAYPAYTSKDEVYWVPGAKEKLPSRPSPRDGATKAPIDAELLFLPAFRATSHKVYFGESKKQLSLLTTLDGEANIAKPGSLSKNSGFVWRVDSVFADGSVRQGQLWAFETADKKACDEHVVQDSSDTCEQAMEECCGDVKGQDNKCLNHIGRHHDKDLVP